MNKSVMGLLLFSIALVGATVGALAYFAPRVATEGRIDGVLRLAGEIRGEVKKSQRELDILRLDILIQWNRQQLRQVEIESRKAPQGAKPVFERQRRDIEDELKVLEDTKSRLKER